MSSGFVILVVLQIGVPLALLEWQAAGRDTNMVAWCLKHIAASTNRAKLPTTGWRHSSVLRKMSRS